MPSNDDIHRGPLTGALERWKAGLEGPILVPRQPEGAR